MALTALVNVIGPAWLTRSTSPLLVTTPVAPAKHVAAVAVPTVKPAAPWKKTWLPAAPADVSAANAPVMVFVAPVPHRSTLPPARTPRLAAVRFPAAVWVTAPPDWRRMVPVGPALSAVLMVRVPVAWQIVMSAPVPPPLVLLAPRKQADGPRTTKV